MLSCTFAGHREVLHAGIQEKLTGVLTELLEQDDEFCFYVGGMGEFDKMCEHAVRRLKLQFAEKQIRLKLVLPYMKKEICDRADFYCTLFDEVIIPECAETEHFKRAIRTRNRWMVEQCQVLIAYVHRDFGGAAEMMKYAEEAGLQVLEISGKTDGSDNCFSERRGPLTP